jgi:hypothetical protein
MALKVNGFFRSPDEGLNIDAVLEPFVRSAVAFVACFVTNTLAGKDGLAESANVRSRVDHIDFPQRWFFERFCLSFSSDFPWSV